MDGFRMSERRIYNIKGLFAADVMDG